MLRDYIQCAYFVDLETHSRNVDSREHLIEFPVAFIEKVSLFHSLSKQWLLAYFLTVTNSN